MTQPCCKEPSNHKHSFKYDAKYCAVCGTWLESTCQDSDCEFCRERPEKADIELLSRIEQDLTARFGRK